MRPEKQRARTIDALPDQAPPQIPDYQMVRCIGRGSYGDIWLAKNVVGTWRAVKVVYRARFDNPRPFEREFMGIKTYEPISRTNEGLVDVLHIGRNDADGYFYYVMELADDAEGSHRDASAEPKGPVADQALLSYCPKTLAGEIKTRGSIPVEECIPLGISLCLALGHLHQNGLIHRDVKPSNIIFVSGVSIIDFLVLL
ncbi:MAG: protein kinase domain-containing protein, partial [Limisphaerales bacterium]